MTEFEKIHFTSTLKSGTNDPEGNTIKSALHQLGYENVLDVRAGKLIEVTIEAGRAQELIQEVLDTKSRDFLQLGSKVTYNYSAEIDSQV